ncbi:MAG: aminoglycoside phosphotransferase family protein [Chloroflexi bacterium]|nr:MAG: aminoglycoside phosphotransferase family protein [Chloroflexota bacterium]
MNPGPQSTLAIGQIENPLLVLFSQIFGSHVQLIKHTLLKEKFDYLVLSVQLCKPDLTVVVKLAGPQALILCPFERTAALYRLVADRTNITVPEVFSADETCTELPWKYLILQHIQGIEWANIHRTLRPDELKAAYSEIGVAAAQLHTIRFSNFGEISVSGIVEKTCSFQDAFRERAQAFIKDEAFFEFFMSVFEHRKYLFVDLGASMTHEDLHHYNLLFQPQQGRWRLATILDFDKAWAGHAESDLARLEIWRGMTNPDFWEAYSSVHTISPFYHERRPVYQLFWCLEFASSTEQHLADTLQVCHELGVRLPKRFI